MGSPGGARRGRCCEDGDGLRDGASGLGNSCSWGRVSWRFRPLLFTAAPEPLRLAPWDRPYSLPPLWRRCVSVHHGHRGVVLLQGTFPPHAAGYGSDWQWHRACLLQRTVAATTRAAAGRAAEMVAGTVTATRLSRLLEAGAGEALLGRKVAWNGPNGKLR